MEDLQDSQVKHSRYAKYHFLSIEDIFPEKDDYSWLTGKGNICKIHKTRSKAALARQIFHAYMLETIWECIDGNQVVTPAKEGLSFFIQAKHAGILASKKALGFYRAYDFEKSFNRAYQMVAVFKRKNRVRYYPIRLARKHYLAIAGRANKGQPYMLQLYG